MLTLKRVASELNVSVPTVRRYIASRKLAAVKLGKEYRVKDEELQKFINKRSSGSLGKLDQENIVKGKSIKTHQKVGYNPTYNFTATETLQEIINDIENIKEIEDFIKLKDPYLLRLFKQVRAMGIKDVRDFIYALIGLEASETTMAHKRINEDLLAGKAAVFFPVPPHVVKAIEAVIPKGRCFNTESFVPKHIQHLDFETLTVDSISDVSDSLVGCTTFVFDGQRLDDKLVVRPNIAALLTILGHNLKNVYFHRIPHIPKGQHFRAFDHSHLKFDVSHI